MMNHRWVQILLTVGIILVIVTSVPSEDEVARLHRELDWFWTNQRILLGEARIRFASSWRAGLWFAALFILAVGTVFFLLRVAIKNRAKKSSREHNDDAFPEDGSSEPDDLHQESLD